MDCLEGMKKIPDNSVDCVITDPPYNINKDAWDRIKGYHDWLLEIFKECERVLKDKGTLWFFHMVFDDLAEIHHLLKNHTSFRHKQQIIINKGLQSIAGRTSENLRSFPRATEYVQFYTFEDVTGSEQLSEKYAKLNPMAKYLREEFKRAGVTNKEIAQLFPSKTGGMTGCVSNWLLGFNFPLKDQYEKMREFLNYEYLRKEYEDLRKEYEDLRKEYEDLRKEYEDLRYTFNLPKAVTDVWDFNFYEDANKGHCSQKPLKLMLRIIKASTNEGDIILDPFSGSGMTAYASKVLNRRFVGFEKERRYIEITQKRLSQNTLLKVIN